MRLRRSIALSVAAGAAILMAAPSAASAAPAAPTGTRSLAAVLTANGNGQFDGNPFDYDIVTQAVLAVVAAKPASPVVLLANGDVALTAFLPSDVAFRDLVRQLTGKSYGSEKQVFDALVAAAGVDTIEAVLLYHVVPGATIASSDAVKADGAALTTAQGGTITVDVLVSWLGVVRLIDQDPTDANPYLNPFALNINKGNKQIAHGITAVLRPIDLP
ncbi:MAG TPA: fasciclin domain-containing protein [Lapillicoccus sp.]|nr:fasciclin domain-containing protein [Lapillicoccus sp.]